jgi:hypothetical protein
MKIKIIGLRILPPIAIGRLGSSKLPLDAFDLEVLKQKPLDFRHIIPKESLKVDPKTGDIKNYHPEKIIFKDATSINDKHGTVRAVAPFLEVFAITDQNPEILVPLTTHLLADAGLALADISWHVELGNIKLYRRTQDLTDKIQAEIKNITTHEKLAINGACLNFRDGKQLPLGHVQFINPSEKFPEIRFRFTPAEGKVYGTSSQRIENVGDAPSRDPLYEKLGEDFLLYKESGPWFGYKEGNQKWPILTNPGGIFAGYNDGELRVSWGYLDDECDGFAAVHLKNADGTTLIARAHISAGPPAYAPDTLPVRVVTDELEQILLGPEVDKEVPIEEAEEIIRRAIETVRLMNTAIMNGNPYEGRARVASTMVAQDSNDFGRMYEPIMATSLVDNLAVRAIHERVFNGIATGAAPWFENALRRPNKIGDLSNEERRKMPSLMRGADGRALCLTYRQINTVIQSATSALFRKAAETLHTDESSALLVSNLKAQLHYRGKGNPFSVLPRTAISNCFPGLELDFRNIWRRAFKGITLIENNNLVIDGEGKLSHLKYHRLVGVNGQPTMVVTTGPTLPNGDDSQILITTANPNGVSFMEWSNNLAHVLRYQGQTITCYFTHKRSKEEVIFTREELNDNNSKLIKVELEVNTFFQENSAVLSDDIVEPGELTQGLCAPWQNDYRECACYYWAASRPDYVNVEPGENGLSKGDNWMTKKRSGNYLPDDRTDTRFITYDDLFENWEGELAFIVKGFDALDSEGNK